MSTKISGIQFLDPISSEPGVMDVVKRGEESGCPFCRVRFRDIPKVGEKICYMSDFMIGKTGVVIQPPPDMAPKLRPDDILVRHDGEPEGSGYCVVNLNGQLISSLPLPELPDWIPPINLRGAEELDRGVIQFCGSSLWTPKPKPDWLAFRLLTYFIWYRRLPITAGELMAMLIAHGVPQKHTRTLAHHFDYGRELLIVVAGRKPILKMRKLTWTYP